MKIIDSLYSCIDSTKKIIFNYFPFEGYYRLVAMLKKYYGVIVKPSLFWTFMASIIYVCVAFLFGWDIMPVVFLVVLLVFLMVYVVWGCLYGEKQKKFYLKND
jgi:hypothetical protein